MLPGMLSCIRTICNTNFRLGGLAKRRFIAVIACVESSFCCLMYWEPSTDGSHLHF